MSKAQSSLQMIFGIFILLIITLVVIGIFLRSAERGTGELDTLGSDYFKQADIQKAISQCEVLCDKLSDVDTAIEYCRKYQKIDFNNNGIIGQEKADRGRFQFCEDFVPCYILADCSDKAYDIAACGKLIKDNREDVFTQLSELDPSGDKGCGITKGENFWFDTFTAGTTGTTQP